MNVARADQIVAACVAAGAQFVSISPGLRSSALALAADAHPDLQTRIILDERDAGYWAVGIGRATGRPAIVITTSGTAVANLLPAVVEADQAAVPMIVLSADRPPRLRGTGANQTIDQPGIFGAAVRAATDLPLPPAPIDLLAALDHGGAPGPVHINCPFDEPVIDGDPAPSPVTFDPPPATISKRSGAIEDAIVVAGPMSLREQEVARTWLADFDGPVLADPLSGLRDGTVIATYDAWIDGAPHEGHLVQIGGPPTSKALGRWLLGHPQRTRIDPDGRRRDEGSPDWTTTLPKLTAHAGRWSEADAAARREIRFEVNTEAAALHEAMGEGRLFVGNSLAVRDLDRFVPEIKGAVFANRGASGIDGNLATLVGISDALGPTTGVIGDLSAQHDIGALALLADSEARLVVIDNDGGGIFRHVPVPAAAFDRLWRTPQRLDLAAAAAAFGAEGQVEVVQVDGVAAAKERARVSARMREAALAALRQD